MKYLKYYKLFESITNFEKTTALIDNYLSLLGFSIKYVKSNSPYENGFIAELNPDITLHPNSVLYILLKILTDYDNLYDVCPVFDNTTLGYHHTENRIQYPVNSLPAHQSTVNYRHIWVTYEQYYQTLIQRLIYTFEDSTGEFNFSSTTAMPGGPDIKSYPFLKNIILEYLNYLHKIIPTNFNEDILYKITYNNIVLSPEPYTLFSNLKKHELYNKIIKFAKLDDIKKSDQMDEMGF